MFDKKSYYNHMKTLEIINFIIYFLIVVSSTISGYYFFNIKGGIASLILSLFGGYLIYLKGQIKVEEMQWRLELLDKTNSNNTTK